MGLGWRKRACCWRGGGCLWRAGVAGSEGRRRGGGWLSEAVEVTRVGVVTADGATGEGPEEGIT